MLFLRMGSELVVRVIAIGAGVFTVAAAAVLIFSHLNKHTARGAQPATQQEKLDVALMRPWMLQSLVWALAVVGLIALVSMMY